MSIDGNGRAHRPAGSPASTGGQFAAQQAPAAASKLPPRKSPAERAERHARNAVDTTKAARGLAAAIRELEPLLAERSSAITFKIDDDVPADEPRRIERTAADAVAHDRIVADVLDKHRVGEHARGLQHINGIERTSFGVWRVPLNEAIARDLDWQAGRSELFAREQAAFCETDVALEVLAELDS